MARRLFLIPRSPFTIFLNNYFTSILLFRQLRKEGINVVETIRSRAADKEFPALLTVLRESFVKKLS